MPLSAAVEQLRRSPFHAADSPLTWSAAWSRPDPEGWMLPADTAAVPSHRVFWAASGAGVLGYPLAILAILPCALGDQSTWCDALAPALALSIPVAAVGTAAWMAGVEPGRAAMGSAIGALVAYPTLYFLGETLNQPLIGLGVGIFTHAAVTTLASSLDFTRRAQP